MAKEPTDADFNAIDSAASAAELSALSRSVDERLAKLESQVAKIEPLLEQRQADAQTAKNLSDYVQDLRNEQVFFNQARYVLAVLVFVVVILLIALAWIAIFHAESPLLSASPATVAAVILGIVSGIVFLINSIAKGLFRSTAERHADGFLPPALGTSLEFYKKVSGSS